MPRWRPVSGLIVVLASLLGIGAAPRPALAQSASVKSLAHNGKAQAIWAAKEREKWRKDLRSKGKGRAIGRHRWQLRTKDH